MKKIFALMAACLLSMSAAWAADDYRTVYTVFNAETGTLTYYYDYESKRKEVGGELYDAEKKRFIGYVKDVRKIVLDNTMMICDILKSTRRMFFSGDYSQKFVNLTAIEGMGNLKTQDVTDMSEMFYGCSALTSIDLSRLDTRSVTNMEGMFDGCSSLESLDLSYFWTHNVTNMNFMFYECKALKSLDLSVFRTENVKEMNSMFFRCKNLTVLDVAGFDMNKVTIISGMFGGCEKLKTIYCNHFWTNIGMDADDLFDGCISLVGEHGTVYDEDHTYLDYARPDSENGNKGYFTTKKETFAYLDEESGTLCFWYGIGRQFLPNAQLVPIQLVDDEMQELYQTKIKKLIFADGMKDSPIEQDNDLKPRNSNHYTKPYKAVETIEGLEKLNTSVLTNWEMMFYQMNIKEIDLTKIDMSPIKNISYIFQGCANLETIYCNEDWNERSDWKKWVGEGKMFDGCVKLKGGKGTTYDTDHKGFSYARPDEEGTPGYFTATLPPKQIYAVFDNGASTMTLYYDRQKEERGGVTEWWEKKEAACAAMGYIVLDESMQNAKPTSTYKWFNYFINAFEIQHLDYLNTAEVTDMAMMFMNCRNLKSIDVSHFNTENVADMGYMFSDCKSLKKIDLSGFKTSKVDDMRGMFENCESLTTIDVRPFNVKNVVNMARMFYNCSNIVAIYGTEDWSEKATNLYDSEDMFKNCKLLPGYKDSNANDITFAHPNEDGNPGYFCTSSPKMLYGSYDDKGELTILYDEYKDESEYNFTPSEWYGANWIKSVVKVVIDETVKEAVITTTADWFNGFTSLREIEHFDYLDFSQVTSTAFMFSGCQILQSFSIPMLGNNTYRMKPQNLSGMFANCMSLETLDLTGLNTYYADDLRGMFFACTYLKTIYCNDDWSNFDDSIDPEDRQTDGIFEGCNWLVGQNGTPYAATKKGIEYAHPDQQGDPGYFTEKKPQGVESVQKSEFSIQKVFRDGQLFIERDGKTFNAIGTEVR